MSFRSKSHGAVGAVERADLDRIETLLTSGRLLAGLRACAGSPPEQGVRDMPSAFEMMVDQSVCDLPEQYLPGICPEERGRLMYLSRRDPDEV